MTKFISEQSKYHHRCFHTTSNASNRSYTPDRVLLKEVMLVIIKTWGRLVKLTSVRGCAAKIRTVTSRICLGEIAS